MEALEILKKDGKIYSFIREKWLVCTPEEVRQNLVCKLVNDFGYPLNLMVEEYRPDLETRGVRSTRADIAIFETEEKKAKNHNAFMLLNVRQKL